MNWFPLFVMRPTSSGAMLRLRDKEKRSDDWWMPDLELHAVRASLRVLRTKNGRHHRMRSSLLTAFPLSISIFMFLRTDTSSTPCTVVQYQSFIVVSVLLEWTTLTLRSHRSRNAYYCSVAFDGCLSSLLAVQFWQCSPTCYVVSSSYHIK